MKFNCEHGFYTFEPESMDDQAYFEANTGLTLTRYGAGLTFPFLAQLPDYSIQGAPYGNLTATVNYAGHPADVFRANGFVFDIENLELVNLADVTKSVKLYPQQNGAYIALELPQAGARYDQNPLLSFTGVARFGNQQFVLRTYEFKDQSI